MKSIFLFIFLCISISTKSQISDFKNIKFDKADNIAKLLEGEHLQNLPLLTYNLTSKLNTDVEKFRAIYTWICTNIKGDYTMHRKVSRKRNQLKNDTISFLKWNKKYTKKVFKNLLKNKKTMCTGYAYLLKTMANIADIECKIIDGYGRNSTVNVSSLESLNHSWNAVKINNKWYLADATWSSGYMNDRGLFIRNYNDGYFLTEPVLFAKNHFPIKQQWLLNNVTTSSTFTNSPIFYSEAFKYKLLPKNFTKIDIIAKKNEEIFFKYKTLKNISDSKIELVKYRRNEEKKLKSMH